MKNRIAAWAALGAVALACSMSLAIASGARAASPGSTSLLIPAKTKLIIEYSRIALA